ncbi:MAG TPA: CBS domain-containing protein [Thermoleophilaceae bacterium]
MAEAANTTACANPKVARDADPDLRVRDVMVARPKTIPADGNVADLRRLFANPHVATALLVDGARFAGAVERDALTDDVSDDLPARELARRDVDSIGPDAPVTAALSRLDADEQRRLVVLDGDGRTLLGLLCLTTDRSGFCVSPDPR